MASLIEGIAGRCSRIDAPSYFGKKVSDISAARGENANKAPNSEDCAIFVIESVGDGSQIGRSGRMDPTFLTLVSSSIA